MRKLLYIILQPPIYALIIIIFLFTVGRAISNYDNGKIRIFSDEELGQVNILNGYNDLPDW